MKFNFYKFFLVSTLVLAPFGAYAVIGEGLAASPSPLLNAHLNTYLRTLEFQRTLFRNLGEGNIICAGGPQIKSDNILEISDRSKEFLSGQLPNIQPTDRSPLFVVELTPQLAYLGGWGKGSSQLELEPSQTSLEDAALTAYVKGYKRIETGRLLRDFAHGLTLAAFCASVSSKKFELSGFLAVVGLFCAVNSYHKSAESYLLSSQIIPAAFSQITDKISRSLASSNDNLLPSIIPLTQTQAQLFFGKKSCDEAQRANLRPYLLPYLDIYWSENSKRHNYNACSLVRQAAQQDPSRSIPWLTLSERIR